MIQSNITRSTDFAYHSLENYGAASRFLFYFWEGGGPKSHCCTDTGTGILWFGLDAAWFYTIWYSDLSLIV